LEKFVIKGGNELKGTVLVSGSKNASLPILFATILSNGNSLVENVPNLRDTQTAIKLLQSMGLKVVYEGNTASVTFSNNIKTIAEYELVKTMRASILCLGPLLSKYRKAKVSLPGGCAIGARPIDLHLKAFAKMGADIKIEHGYVVAEAKRGLKGAEINFDFPTVGGTENVMMAAVLARGKTIIRNAAKEPEIVDLAKALRSAGALIEGAGSDTIEIQGIDGIGSINHKVMPDRIEAGTFIAAIATAGGEVEIKDFPSSVMKSVVDKFTEAGLDISIDGNSAKVKKKQKLRSVDIVTQVYPGFPTDMQAQFMASMCLAGGTSIIKETVFENRFMHVLELQRLGANIKIEGNSAIVKGVEKLIGAKVMATDLRASASLVIAGLAAENTTEVYRIYHLDRGYENLEKKLKELGANIRREKSELPY